jgi:purine-binding chemotaxis protein CheW
VAPDTAIEATCSVTRAKALSELADRMSKLTELTNRLLEQRLALSNTTAPSLTLEDSDSPAENSHYLSFALGDEQFAISTLNVYGAVEATQLIAGPGVPPKVRKAIRLRGALVPVIDLGAHLAGHPIKIGWNTRIILLEVTSRERLQIIGVVVDTVGKVLEIAPADIQPPAASDSQIRNDFALGTVTLDSRLITLLDIGQGLSAHELVTLRSTTQAVVQENTPI